MSRFEGDEENVAHIARHHVTPGEIEELFDSPRIIQRSKKVSGRCEAYGTTARRRYLVVVFVALRGRIRTITAFSMNPSTRKNMPRNSNKKTFKSEAEEAAWWASSEGRKTVEREMDKGMRNGTAKLYSKGLNVKRTDPAVLEELMARVRAKQTKAVSIRLPAADIEAAKALGARAGIGYQTVLKQIISKGLGRAS